MVTATPGRLTLDTRSATVRGVRAQIPLFDAASLLPSGELRAVLDTVCADTGVDLLAVLSPSRRRAVVAARRRIARELRARGWSYARISRALDRAPSTVAALIPLTRREQLRAASN